MYPVKDRATFHTLAGNVALSCAGSVYDTQISYTFLSSEGHFAEPQNVLLYVLQTYTEIGTPRTQSIPQWSLQRDSTVKNKTYFPPEG